MILNPIARIRYTLHQIPDYNRQCLEDAAAHHTLTAGPHLELPGFYYVAKQGDGFLLKSRLCC